MLIPDFTDLIFIVLTILEVLDIPLRISSIWSIKFKTWLIKELSQFKMSLPMPMVIHCWIMEESLLTWLTQSLKHLLVKIPQVIVKCLRLNKFIMILLVRDSIKNLLRILRHSLKVGRTCLSNWVRHVLFIQLGPSLLILTPNFIELIDYVHIIQTVLGMILKIVSI